MTLNRTWLIAGLVGIEALGLLLALRGCNGPGGDTGIRAERDSAIVSVARVLAADSALRGSLHEAITALGAKQTVILRDVDTWKHRRPGAPVFAPGSGPSDSIRVLLASDHTLRASLATADTLLDRAAALNREYKDRLAIAVARGDLLADTLAHTRKVLIDTKQLDCALRRGEIRLGRSCLRPSATVMVDVSGHIREGIGYSLTRR